jgi:subtilisin family serine protease
MRRKEKLLSRFFGNTSSANHRQQKLRRSLSLGGVEQLETRSLLAAVIGDGDAGRVKPIIPPTEDYVPNQVLIKLRDGVSTEAANQLRSEVGATTIDSFEPLGIQVWELPMPVGPLTEIDSQAIVPNAIDRFWNDERIKYIEPNYIVQTLRSPDDTRYSEMWGLHNIGQSGGTTDADIDAPEAWDIATGTTDIIIGVIDTGVDYNHPDLRNNMWKNAGEVPGDGEDNDGNGFVDDVNGWDFANSDNDPMDDVDHGTHVAGTIAAEGNNSIGVVGVNWRAKIMPIKFLGLFGGTTAGAIGSVNYATRMGAHLTNNSWGGGGFSQALKDAITAAGAANQLFVAAAGNSNFNNDLIPSYPSGYDNDNIIAVAASDHDDERASFSQWGARTVDLAAPGVDILSTFPVSMGSYGSISGTSMASPHVAGVAGLVLSQDPTLSTTELKNIILQSTDKIPAWNGLVLTGGRLNALNALGLVAGNRVSVAVADGLAGETLPGESTNAGEFTFSLSEPARNNPVVINYTMAGTAKNGIDYSPLSGSVTIPVARSSAVVTIRPIDDKLVEGVETVRLNVLPGGYAVGISTAVITLLDNDVPPVPTVSLSVIDGTAKENNIAQPVNSAMIRIRRTGVLTLPLNVAYGIGGSATNEVDYGKLTGIATIPADRAYVDVSINPIDDINFEGSENIVLALTNRLTYRIDPAAKDGTITLLDNDPQNANANDNFRNRVLMTGNHALAEGANTLATAETGEPNNAGTSGGKSVWWSWKATSTKKFELSTRGSSFDTTLGVYNGGRVDALRLVAENDDEDFNRGIFTSKLQFNAIVDRWYHFSVDGYSGDSGDIQLRLSEVIGPSSVAPLAPAGSKAGPTTSLTPSSASPSLDDANPETNGQVAQPAGTIVGGNQGSKSSSDPFMRTTPVRKTSPKVVDGLFRSVGQLIGEGPESI